jgi:hypothetical protein
MNRDSVAFQRAETSLAALLETNPLCHLRSPGAVRGSVVRRALPCLHCNRRVDCRNHALHHWGGACECLLSGGGIKPRCFKVFGNEPIHASSPKLLRLSHLLGGNVTNRFLFVALVVVALVVFSSLLEVTFPAGALPVPVAILAIQSTGAADAFILSKSVGTGEKVL